MSGEFWSDFFLLHIGVTQKDSVTGLCLKEDSASAAKLAVTSNPQWSGQQWPDGWNGIPGPAGGILPGKSEHKQCFSFSHYHCGGSFEHSP